MQRDDVVQLMQSMLQGHADLVSRELESVHGQLDVSKISAYAGSSLHPWLGLSHFSIVHRLDGLAKHPNLSVYIVGSVPLGIITLQCKIVLCPCSTLASPGLYHPPFVCIANDLHHAGFQEQHARGCRTQLTRNG